MTRKVSVRLACARDEQYWRNLVEEYSAVSDTSVTDQAMDRLWAWILDPDRQMICIVSETEGGDLLGFAHVRPYERGLTASMGLYLEDLFVTEHARGKHVADDLLRHIFKYAKDLRCDMVSWMTEDDNYRARAAYDRHAEAQDWIVYERSV